MRNQLERNAAPLVAAADEAIERLARLEEQMRHVVAALEKLSNRESELEENMRALSEKFMTAINSQSEMFHDSLKEVADSFVSREDWAFWKSLLVAAFLALIAYGWNTLIGAAHR